MKCDNINLEEPWGIITDSCKLRFREEIDKELNIGHILFRKDFQIIGRRYDRDDILLMLNNMKYAYAIVHLTWSGKPEFKNYPLTWLYNNKVELEKEIMLDNYSSHINLVTCCHLQELENYLRNKKYPIEFEGAWWSEQKDSVYFDVYLDKERLLRRFNFGDCVEYYEYDGRMAGQEAGFMCKKCKCNIAGNHKLYSKNKIVVQ